MPTTRKKVKKAKRPNLSKRRAQVKKPSDPLAELKRMHKEGRLLRGDYARLH